MQRLGPKTEMGLKELFIANSEDHFLLKLSAGKLEQAKKIEEAKIISEKSMTEFRHARGIFEKLVSYLGEDKMLEWLKEIEKMKEENSRDIFVKYSTIYMLSSFLSDKKVEPEVKVQLQLKSKECLPKILDSYEKILNDPNVKLD
ncbi:hypothetical protein [Sulfuracidifex metallicus]|uniref:Uncharacterized protein n=1 Tax=Sulfuracidifex metallicus DSM 6482 = JCM 9184 TaxID=523847 RepID=A0A6A9QJ66_SULME|nr:hypothetical protein [Sulfuracidifex metallicus]MUN29327.1 hypothetical protein [Sulfuracidifex metallicus DSM 6482 = JCM 9184]